MVLKRRSFRRQIGQRRYRKLFIICTEGSKTEPQYFQMFQNSQSISFKFLKSKHSDPLSLLEKMEQYLERNRLKFSDEAWVVLDRDRWTEEQFKQIFLWAQKEENHHVALSNPNFEYWLLLHFEDCSHVDNYEQKLRQHYSKYDKQIQQGKFDKQKIENAIQRAKAKDLNNNPEIYLNIRGTTVHRLVENILALQV